MSPTPSQTCLLSAVHSCTDEFSPFTLSLGTKEAPATSITGRISIVRSSRHRSLDVSVEYQPCTAAGKGKSETIIVEV